MKTTTTKAVSKKVEEATEALTIKFIQDKETKGAIRFVAEGLEASNIYFKKTELEALGLEGKTSFTVTINA
jgi:hypothetical protein